MSTFNKYVGVPWKMDGKDLTGCNCWVLLKCIYEHEYGIFLPEFVEEFSALTMKNLKELGELSELEQIRNWDEVAEPNIGDGVLMKARGTPHIGCYVGGGRILHMLQDHSSIVERINSLFIRDRIIGYYRHKERSKFNVH